MTHNVKVAVVGGGIVGSTAAYYLRKFGLQVDLYDYGQGQATRAAAGIICPWFTLRRNKPWYHLVSHGAEFYRQLVNDLHQDNLGPVDFFKEVGTILIRKNEKSILRDQAKAQEKIGMSPSIKELVTVRSEDLKTYLPLLETSFDASFVKGGARVDGALLIETLQSHFIALGGNLIAERASLIDEATVKDSKGTLRTYDHILLSVGAWLPEILEPLGYKVGIRPQKGQLLVVKNEASETDDWPLLMPPGKVDIIPIENGRIIIGATHEDDQGYDLSIDKEKLQELLRMAKDWMPDLDHFSLDQTKVGTRAYTDDYTVLLGKVPETNSLWAVSGLGSSGLTSGPFIGYQWAKLIEEGSWEINIEDYPIEHHIVKI